MHTFRTCILFTILYFISHTASTAQFSITIESGAFFSGYNDVRVPNGSNNAGTLFSLDDDFSPKDGRPYFRAELAYVIKNRHILELTAAPLIITYRDGAFNGLEFAEQQFSGDNILGTYEFNTYRASYRYRVLNKSRFNLDLGATILVRDARIALEEGMQMADDTDLGFVPLLSFDMSYDLTNNVSFMLKGDALVGTQGRAEDIFAGFRFNAYKNKLFLRTGYRLIEGGADVDQVYNFALIHFAAIGLTYNL